MRIQHLELSDEATERLRTDLQRLIDQPGDKELRPCPGCTIRCPCTGSTTCQCSCSPACSGCAQAMSSDAERYPIEEKVVPLVYAFYTTRLCPPCWSCEGHTRGDSEEVSKLPRLWFHARSEVYPRLVVEYIEDLAFSKRLQNLWGVHVLGWATHLETRYSLEPVVDGSKPLTLKSLQSDLKVMADDLCVGIQTRAQALLAQEFEPG